MFRTAICGFVLIFCGSPVWAQTNHDFVAIWHQKVFAKETDLFAIGGTQYTLSTNYLQLEGELFYDGNDVLTDVDMEYKWDTDADFSVERSIETLNPNDWIKDFLQGQLVGGGENPPASRWLDVQVIDNGWPNSKVVIYERRFTWNVAPEQQGM